MSEDVELDWEELVRADRDCRVYWGSTGCRLERGHVGPHADARGRNPWPGYAYGEDTTADERAEMD